MTQEEKLAAANRFLASRDRNAVKIVIVRKKNGFYVEWTNPVSGRQMSRRWMAQEDSPYPVWHRRRSWGGTTMRAIHSLIEWLRGNPSAPESVLRRWAQVQAFPSSAVDQLLADGYPSNSGGVDFF
ncbi:MAG: hypothetical protein AAGA67_02115 [Cyanobacteria bacterium P01_F01_bin.153]